VGAKNSVGLMYTRTPLTIICLTVTFHDQWGEAALFCGATEGQTEVAAYLLDKGADIHGLETNVSCPQLAVDARFPTLRALCT
jgi:hypothetical protein